MGETRTRTGLAEWIERMERLASSATPGPYAASTSPEMPRIGSLHVYSARFGGAVAYGRSWTAQRNGDDDMRYFAALDPETMRLVLAVIRGVDEWQSNKVGTLSWDVVREPYRLLLDHLEAKP